MHTYSYMFLYISYVINQQSEDESSTDKSSEADSGSE